MELSLRIKVEPFQNSVKLQAAVSMMANKNPPPPGHLQGTGMGAKERPKAKETGLTTGDVFPGPIPFWVRQISFPGRDLFL